MEKGDLFYIPKGYKYHSYWSGPEKESLYSIGFLDSLCSTEYRLQKITPSKEAEEVLQVLLLPDMEQDNMNQRDHTVERAMEYTRRNPCVKALEVAANCGISESTLYLISPKSLHKTPNEVRRELQCERAAVLLTTTDLTVEEISASLRFSSSTYFRKVFRQITGNSSSRYRKKDVI